MCACFGYYSKKIYVKGMGFQKYLFLAGVFYLEWNVKELNISYERFVGVKSREDTLLSNTMIQSNLIFGTKHC